MAERNLTVTWRARAGNVDPNHPPPTPDTPKAPRPIIARRLSTVMSYYFTMTFIGAISPTMPDVVSIRVTESEPITLDGIKNNCIIPYLNADERTFYHGLALAVDPTSIAPSWWIEALFGVYGYCLTDETWVAVQAALMARGITDVRMVFRYKVFIANFPAGTAGPMAIRGGDTIAYVEENVKFLETQEKNEYPVDQIVGICGDLKARKPVWWDITTMGVWGYNFSERTWEIVREKAFSTGTWELGLAFALLNGRKKR